MFFQGFFFDIPWVVLYYLPITFFQVTLLMRRKSRKDNEPTHHVIVESADWSAILEARRTGVSWDNLRTRTGLSSLGMAIFEGSPLAVQTLLEFGAPIQTEQLYNGSFFSPLWSALEKNNAAIVHILLQAGADPNEEHPEHGTPILYTSLHAMRDATTLLCQNGAIPNTNSAPSPLWLWIKHLTPQQDPQTQEWVFSDSSPIMNLLKAGARIHGDEQDGDEQALGMNEIEFAKHQWLRHQVRAQDMHNIQMTLSLMEKNLYTQVIHDEVEGIRDTHQHKM